jgi:pyridinium-3,5-bisthiocarboxylic acid mononucleotide nickel chelatase
MRRIYFDCYSGAAGDMLLGALVDVGLSVDELTQALGALQLSGYRLQTERVTRQGVSGTRLWVDTDVAGQHGRHLSDILALVQGSGLPTQVKTQVGSVFGRLAEAEAAVHGVTVDEVHFHEVGAVDSIVDIVGCVWGLYALRVGEVFSSALPLGEGWVETAHGRLPLPAPATLKLLAGANAPTRPLEVGVELVTPTAAALLAELATFAQPPLILEAVGYGFGQRELAWPNAVRAWLGSPDSLSEPGATVDHDTVVLLECNLDDTTGEALGYAMERLLSAGALDVWFTPIQMKKNRPASKLSVLALPGSAGGLAQLLLQETTTLGVRQTLVNRIKAGRESMPVETEWGTITVKLKRMHGQPISASPEYEECAALARRSGVPLQEIYALAQAAAREKLRGGR